jgi:predicted RNA-binding protein
MMVVVLTQCDNDRKQNLFGYDKILLIGFDYSWKPDGKYYAFDHEAGGKYYYMRHVYGIGPSGNFVFTSNNLNSSASWLKLYVDAFRIPVIQSSKDSLYYFGRYGDLKDHIVYRHKASDQVKIRDLLKEKQRVEEKLKRLQNDIVEIARDHWFASQAI